MGVSEAGTVVIVPFPFSDLSEAKVRPAVVLTSAGRGDWILCQVTSNSYGDSKAVEINHADFSRGRLRQTSYARPGKIFTAHDSLIQAEIGILKRDSFQKIREAVIELFK